MPIPAGSTQRDGTRRRLLFICSAQPLRLLAAERQARGREKDCNSIRGPGASPPSVPGSDNPRARGEAALTEGGYTSLGSACADLSGFPPLPRPSPRAIICLASVALHACVRRRPARPARRYRCTGGPAAPGPLEHCHGSLVTVWRPVTCQPRLRIILPRVNLGRWQWGVVGNVRAEAYFRWPQVPEWAAELAARGHAFASSSQPRNPAPEIRGT